MRRLWPLWEIIIYICGVLVDGCFEYARECCLNRIGIVECEINQTGEQRCQNQYKANILRR